jgi:phage terminase large subunit GpA-like protein
MTPDEWASRNRIYPATAQIPGPRDPYLTPYIIDVERAVAERRFKRVVMVTSAQEGKTEMMLDLAGSRLDQRPAPVLYVGPSKQFLQEQFEPRVMSLLDDATSLTAKVVRGKRMTKTRKIVAGVPFRLAHAGSSSSLKSDPAALALIDEYDEMLNNIKGKGDPLGLVEARGDTFPDFVSVVTSTCTRGSVEFAVDAASGLEMWQPTDVENLFESPIWALWQQGTRHHWCWPCPMCKEYFVPRLACVKWPDNASPFTASKRCHLECPRCGGVIEEKHKIAMNSKGRYVAPGQKINRRGEVTGAPPESTTLSYWVSGLASPFVTFGDRVKAFLEAKESRDDARVQTATNAQFGELFALGKATAPKWEEVADHKSDYAKGELPTEALRLIVAVDVQINRLIYLTRGWGARSTSWLVEWGQMFGDTTHPEVWSALGDYITNPICGMNPSLVLIDSGFRPGKKDDLPLNRVYDFCRRYPRLVRATKGANYPMLVPLKIGKVEVTKRGTSLKYGLDLLRLDTDHWKSWVHERLNWPEDELGSWYLPHDVDEDYLRQIVSESRVVNPNGKPMWVEHTKYNHFLDCEAMQAAGAHLLNMARVPPSAQRRREEAAPPPGNGGIINQLA